MATDSEQLFLRWLKENGAEFEAIEWPSCREETQYSRGAVATRDIHNGESIVKIPFRLMITPLTVKNCPILSPIIWPDGPSTEPLLHSEESRIALFLMSERLKGKKSFFYPYICILPEYDGPSTWFSKEGSREPAVHLEEDRSFDRHQSFLSNDKSDGPSPLEHLLDELQDEELKRTVKTRRIRRKRMYTIEMLPLCSGNPDALPVQKFTFELYDWAMMTIEARAFGRRLPWSALVPLADCLNHANVCTKYALQHDNVNNKKKGPDSSDLAKGSGGAEPESAIGKMNEERLALPAILDNSPNVQKSQAYGLQSCSKMITMIQQVEHELNAEYSSESGWFFSLFAWGGNPGYKKGKEVFNSYGRRSNRHLMMNYGFSMEYNEHDMLRFTTSLPPGVPAVIPEGSICAHNVVSNVDNNDGDPGEMATHLKDDERMQKKRQLGRLRLFEPFPVTLRADEFNQKFMGLCRLAAMSIEELQAYGDARVGVEGSKPKSYAPSARFPSGPVSREKEIKTLEIVRSFLEDRLRSFPTTSEYDQMLLECVCIKDWFRSAISYRLSLKMILLRHKHTVAGMLESMHAAHDEHDLDSLYKQSLSRFLNP